MDAEARKKILAIQRYVVANFSASDWLNLAQLTNSEKLVNGHNRLLRSLGFGDDDYEFNAISVINAICEADESNIQAIIDFYDVDLWLEQNDPARFSKIFGATRSVVVPGFWKKGFVKAFISHLAISKAKACALKEQLETWGVTCFVAHEDIEPTKEWMVEIESALRSMELLIALLEPKFKESNWTDQEVGFALARGVDVVPLRTGADPYGFLGKYQGLQAKGRIAKDIAEDVVTALLKKPRLKEKLFAAFIVVLPTLSEKLKVERLRDFERLAGFSDDQMRSLIESAALTESEKSQLSDLIKKYHAFEEKSKVDAVEDDLPF